MGLRFPLLAAVVAGGASAPVEYVLGENAGDTPANTRFSSMILGDAPGGSDGFGHFSMRNASLVDPARDRQGIGRFTDIPTILAGKTIISAQIELTVGELRFVSGAGTTSAMSVQRCLRPWRAAQETLGFGTRITWDAPGSIGGSVVNWNTAGGFGEGTDCVATESAVVELTHNPAAGTVIVISGPQIVADVQAMVDDPEVAQAGWFFRVSPTFAVVGMLTNYHFLAEEATAANEPGVAPEFIVRPRLRVTATG